MGYCNSGVIVFLNKLIEVRVKTDIGNIAKFPIFVSGLKVTSLAVPFRVLEET